MIKNDQDQATDDRIACAGLLFVLQCNCVTSVPYLATAVKASSTLTPVLALVSMKGTEYSWRDEEQQTYFTKCLVWV